MKRVNLLMVSAAMWSSTFAAYADELGTGRDTDGPNELPPPPAEGETTTESPLQQILEWFGVSTDQ